MKKSIAAVLFIAALAACSPKKDAPRPPAVGGGGAAPAAAQSCDIKTDAHTYRVTFGTAPDGGAGTIGIDVLVGHDAGRQTLNATGASAPAYPKLEDADGDGKADILI